MEELLWKMAIPIVQGNLTEAYDKARYILYPEVYTPYAALHNATHKQLLAVYCKLCCNWHSSVDHGNAPYGPSQCE